MGAIPPDSASSQDGERGTARNVMDTIRVVLADDHDILRDGLRALLGTLGDVAVVGEARNGREAVAQTERLRPDVVLMDIAMPELDGIEACRRIRQQVPSARVLFLTMHESEEYFFRALRAGAAGYIIKRAAAAELVVAVRAVAAGEAFLSPSAAHSLVSEYGKRRLEPDWTGPDADDRYATLTGREREILQLVGEGFTNQEIADRLRLSIKTVQSHRAAVMEKLGLRNVTHLVRYAVRKGLVDPER
jgi:two-component system response regulator NreC